MSETDPAEKPCFCGRPRGEHQPPRIWHPHDPTPLRLQYVAPPTDEDRRTALCAEQAADILARRQRAGDR